MPLAPPPENLYPTQDLAEEAVKSFAWQEGYSIKKERTKTDKQKISERSGLHVLMEVNIKTEAHRSVRHRRGFSSAHGQ